MVAMVFFYRFSQGEGPSPGSRTPSKKLLRTPSCLGSLLNRYTRHDIKDKYPWSMPVKMLFVPSVNHGRKGERNSLFVHRFGFPP